MLVITLRLVTKFVLRNSRIRKFRKIFLFCSTWNQFDPEFEKLSKYGQLCSIILFAIGILLAFVALCCWYTCNKARYKIAEFSCDKFNLENDHGF